MQRAVTVIMLLLATVAVSMGTAVAAPSGHESELGRDLLRRLNEERSARGLHTLRWEGDLATLAHDWSVYMGETGDYRHRDLTAAQQQLPRYVGIGENIHQLLARYESTGYAHRDWMRSDGHRRNMLNPGYDAVGIGVFCAPDGRMWATMNLGRYSDSSAPPFTYSTPPASPIVHDDQGGPSCGDKNLVDDLVSDGAGLLAPHPPESVSYVRAAGADRVGTAVAAARASFEPGVPAVVLARADAFADALAGSVLAGAADGPVLLTSGASLPASVRAEIERLDPATVYVLGGRSAIPDSALHGLAGRVVRLSGADRFETAASIAVEVFGRRGHAGGSAYLANGVAGWPDAVAVSGLAAHTRRPLLLTLRDELPATTRELIADAGLSQVTIVGGTGVVSEAVEEQLGDLGVDVARIAGADRYATAREARVEARRAGMNPAATLVATLRGWPDALVVGAMAAHQGGLVVAVSGGHPDREPSDIDEYAWTHRDHIRTFTVVGGQQAVSDTLVAAVFERMRD